MATDNRSNEISQQLQYKVYQWSAAVRKGHRLNDALTRSKAFRNPYAVQPLLQKLAIQEYSSLLPPIQEGFPAEGTFYDQLKQRQAEKTDLREKEALERAQGKLEPRAAVAFTTSVDTARMNADDQKRPAMNEQRYRSRSRSRSPRQRSYHQGMWPDLVFVSHTDYGVAGDSRYRRREDDRERYRDRRV
jgi:hypothetical protein